MPHQLLVIAIGSAKIFQEGLNFEGRTCLYLDGKPLLWISVSPEGKIGAPIQRTRQIYKVRLKGTEGSLSVRRMKTIVDQDEGIVSQKLILSLNRWFPLYYSALIEC